MGEFLSDRAVAFSEEVGMATGTEIVLCAHESACML